MTVAPASGETSVAQRRIRAWQAWLAIAGLVGHLLAMIAMSGSAHAMPSIVDPATGQRLEISLCTDAGIVPAPGPEGPGAAHRAQAHDCVLCGVHGTTAARAPMLAFTADLLPGRAWAPLSAPVPEGGRALAAWARGPPPLG